jgi:LTXXQ motif family protein
MTATSRTIIAAAIVTGLGVAGTAAIAQQHGGAPAQDGKTGDGGFWRRDHDGLLPSQRAEARLAYIKTALQITPAQTAQWNAFADVVRKHAKERDARVAEMRAKFDQHHDGDNSPDLMERLEFRQKMLSTAAANADELLNALKPLYASFSDSQKQIAAEVLNRHGEGGRHHMDGR